MATEYRRDRAVGLVEGRDVQRPTEEEWRLAESYLSWLRRQLRWSLAYVIVLALLTLSISAIAGSRAWNFVLIMGLMAFLQGWRVRRWQRRLKGLRPARDNVG